MYRIAVLMHARDDESVLDAYLVSVMAEYWREAGHEVVFLFGTDRYVPADVVFVHVDLSVVPDQYLAFARRYRVAVNGRVKDIRKSRYSRNVVGPDDPWEGPVIVKTERNHGGAPERERGNLPGRLGRKALGALRRLGPGVLPPVVRSPADYHVYDHLRDVPRLCFHDPSLIVERFTPEVRDGLYCVRLMSFLGTHVTCTLLKGRHPVVNGATTEVVEHDVEPHPEIQAIRHEMGFDYGKFDYVEVGGAPILLDANKTTGCDPDLLADPGMTARRRYRAEGLFDLIASGGSWPDPA